MPNGMLPTYRRRACLVIWLPTAGTCVGAAAKQALVGVASRAMLGICPAATLQHSQLKHSSDKNQIISVENIGCCNTPKLKKKSFQMDES